MSFLECSHAYALQSLKCLNVLAVGLARNGGRPSIVGVRSLVVACLQASVKGYEEVVKEITATGEVLSDNAQEEAEVEALIQADIAAQLKALQQVGLRAC